MSQDLSKLTMAGLIDQYAQAIHAKWTRFGSGRSIEAGNVADRVRVEIDRRLAEAIEVGGSEVRYALEGAS